MENITVINHCDKNGNCSRCGDCCTPFLPTTKNEIKTIREYLKRHPNIMEQVENTPQQITMCCFYDREKKECMIYEVRPQICRSFKCNLSKEKIFLNKEFINKKAFYNTLDPRTITDFRELFFNCSSAVAFAILYHLDFDKEKAKDFCKFIGKEYLIEEIDKEVWK